MKTILIVDDEPEVLQLLGETLRKFGYRVREHADALSALSALRQDARVDLVITDLQMPGMNGTEFITELGRLAPSAPVIMLTAYGDIDTYFSCLSRGVFDYVHKPVKAQELERIVKAALDAPTQERRSGAP